MEDFIPIYKILNTLRDMLDFDEINADMLHPQRFGLSRVKRDALLVILYKAGYIDGLGIEPIFCGDKAIINVPPIPSITLKGLAYLHNSKIMKKVRISIAKGCHK